MPTRSAEARWQGTLKEGQGTMRLGSGAFEGAYSFGTRFAEEPGTNPEELIGAAHAGCFSMALSGILTNAGTPPQSIETNADVVFEKIGDAFTITRINLRTEGDVPGLTPEQFVAHAETAKANCPVSRLLAPGTEITLEAKLA